MHLEGEKGRVIHTLWDILLDVLLWVAVPIGLLLLFCSCTPSALQVQAQTADAIAKASNAGLPSLVAEYKDQGDEQIDAAAAKPGATEGGAWLAVEGVKKKWEVVWKAWETLSAAHDAWSTAVERGGETSETLGALRAAYCKLLGVWPEEIPAIPLSPVVCPKGAAR